MDQKNIWVYLSFAFSALILSIILFSTFNEETFGYLSHLNIFCLVLAIALRVVSFSLWAERIRVMSGALGYCVSFKTCFVAVIANLLVAAITPSSAGGEPVRIHELFKSGVKVGDATAIVIVERFLDAIILVIMAAIGILLMWDLISALGDAFVAVIFFSIGMLLMFDLLLILAVKYPVMMKRRVNQIIGAIKKRWNRPSIDRVASRIDEEFDLFSSGLTAFAGHARMGLFIGFVYSFLFWFSEFLVASVILVGLGLAPSIGNSLFAQIIIALVSMIPLTPGAAGIAEISAASLYALFVPTAVLGVFILLWRLIMFYLNIVFGFIGTMLIVKREVMQKTKAEK
ncbi:MAG TPA: flippase-like domain-containing protein [Methanospirillum sp.]|nr:flippase-like domain-containing protein [Methanospirillum sp.]